MLDRSRIQGFGSDGKDGKPEETPGFFGTFKESVSSKFSDAIGEVKEEMDRPWTPLQDISEMAQEIKSFVTGAVGIEQTAPALDAIDEESQEVGVSPRQRCEATNLISKFAQSYKPARVAPTSAELASIWSSCSGLQPNAVASVIYDHLSFSNGELEWQPRLRILYYLEVLYWKGSPSKDIALGIHTHAAGLLQHLATEVPQTKEKATEVLETLAGNVSEAPPSMKDVESKALASDKGSPAKTASSTNSSPEKAASSTSPAKSQAAYCTQRFGQDGSAAPSVAPPMNLLDLSVTPSSASASSAPAAKAAAPVDLLGFPAPSQSSDAPIVDLISLTNAREAAAAAPSAPSAAPLTAPSAAPLAAPTVAANNAFDPNRVAGIQSNLLSLDLSGGPAKQSPPVAAATLEQARFCAGCGAAFGHGAAFCAGCGSRRQPAQVSQSSSAASSVSPYGAGMAALGGGMAAMGGGMRPMGSSAPAMGSGMSSMSSSMVSMGASGGGGGFPSSPSGYRAAPGSASMGPPLAAGKAQPQRPMASVASSWPSASEVQSMQSDRHDPFAFAADMMQDFTAGN